MGALARDRSARDICRLSGQGVLLAGSILATIAVFAAFLPVNLGIDPRLEPIPMVLHAGAGACALGLVIMFLADRDVVVRATSHPMVLAAAFVAVWSLAVAPLTDYPWLSMLGENVFAEGAVRYASLAVFFTSGLVLADDRRTLRTICAAVMVVSFGAPIVMFALAQDYFVSLDLVGPFAISGAIAAWLLFGVCRMRTRLTLAILAAAPALVLSTNHSVIVFMVLVGFPAGIAAHWFLSKNTQSETTIRRLVLVAVVAAPVAGLLAKWLLPELVSLPSILSRHLLDRVLFAALHADPVILAVGQGWGAINLTVDSHILSAGAVMWDSSWDLAERNISHSHSVYGEALFGAGLPAVASVLAMFAAPALAARRDSLPLAVFAVLTIATLSAVSAEFPATVGAVALMFALTAQPARDQQLGQTFRAIGRGVAYAMPFLAALLFVAAGWAFANDDEIRARTADIRARGGESPFGCEIHLHSWMYGDIDLARGLVASYRPVFLASERGETPAVSNLRVLDAYVCTAEKRAVTSRSSSLQIALETYRIDLALAALSPDLRARYANSLENWPQKVVRALNVAPDRVDLSKGFLVSQMAQGNLETVESLSKALLDRDSEDPVAMWFLGLARDRSASAPDQEEGRRLLRAALEAGILRFFPIPEQTVQEIRASAPPNR